MAHYKQGKPTMEYTNIDEVIEISDEMGVDLMNMDYHQRLDWIEFCDLLALTRLNIENMREERDRKIEEYLFEVNKKKLQN